MAPARVKLFFCKNKVTELSNDLEGILNNLSVETDTTLSVAGKPADAEAVGNELYTITGNKRIAFSDPSLKQYINTNVSEGTVVSWDTPSISSITNIKWAVVECAEGDEFTLNGSGGNNDRLWAFLDGDKKLISKSVASLTAENMTLIVPQDSAYLIINDETDKQSFYGVLIVDSVKSVKTVVDKMGRDNLFNKADEDIETGRYINKISSGQITWSNNANFGETGFIPVKPGDRLTIFNTVIGEIHSGMKMARFDSEKSPVSVVQINADNYYTVVDGISYIRFVFPLEYIDSLMVIKLFPNDELPFSAEGEVYTPFNGLTLPYLKKLIDDCASEDEVDDLRQEIAGTVSLGAQWNGKSWYAYGTSLTNISIEGKYAKYVRDLSGLNLTNKGTSGGGICNNTRIKNAVMNVTDGKLNADLITIEVGANDTTAPLGTIYDTGDDTFCGALNQCIRYLQENTNAQIVIISSTNARENNSGSSAAPEVTYGSDNHTKFDQWEATRKVCEINSCYYIPMGETANMSWARMNASNLYNVDNIHHTELGGYNLGLFVWYQLRNIPNWFTAIPS